VLVIVGVLSRIAYAAYTANIAKGRRNAAQGCLMEQAQFMERVYTTNMSYASASLPAASQQCQLDLASQYTFSIPSKTASQYTVKATAIGTQSTKDANCSWLTVDQSGARSATNTGCW